VLANLHSKILDRRFNLDSPPLASHNFLPCYALSHHARHSNISFPLFEVNVQTQSTYSDRGGPARSSLGLSLHSRNGKATPLWRRFRLMSITVKGSQSLWRVVLVYMLSRLIGSSHPMEPSENVSECKMSVISPQDRVHTRQSRLFRSSQKDSTRETWWISVYLLPLSGFGFAILQKVRCATRGFPPTRNAPSN
jgi:hypothetical protein